MSCVDDYIGDMATFIALAKIYSTKYFCNTKVAGFGKNFCPAKISGYTVPIIIVCKLLIAIRELIEFTSSANLYRSAAGSVPWERTKMRGVVGEESRNTRPSSAVCGSMNL